MFNDACDKFEKIYASAPEHFVSSFNQIPRIRSILADYYRFKERNIHKAIAEYDKLIPVLDRFSKDQRAAVPYLFMLGEIYEHEVKDYNKGISYYGKVLDAMENQKNVRSRDDRYLSAWFVTWMNFVIDRIRVQELGIRPNSAPRILKYPNVDYMIASSFGIILAAIQRPSSTEILLMTARTISGPISLIKCIIAILAATDRCSLA